MGALARLAVSLVVPRKQSVMDKHPVAVVFEIQERISAFIPK
jgi:hypothetical protein